MLPDQPLPSELSQEPAPRPKVVRDAELAPPDGPRSVEGFLAWLTALNGKVGGKVPLFKNIELALRGDRLVARCRNKFGYDQLLDPARRKLAGQLIKEYFGPATYLVIELDEAPRPKAREELMGEAREHPVVRRVVETFGARVVDARPRLRA